MSVVNHYFEAELQEHVIVVNGKDFYGNDLGGQLELMIRTEGIGKIGLHGIEALVNLLRGVDDWGVISHKVGGDSRVRGVKRGMWEPMGEWKPEVRPNPNGVIAESRIDSDE